MRGPGTGRRYQIWEAEEGCRFEDINRTIAAKLEGGDRVQGVVIASTRNWFRILWDSGREEKVFRDYRSAARHKTLAVVPSGS